MSARAASTRDATGRDTKHPIPAQGFEPWGASRSLLSKLTPVIRDELVSGLRRARLVLLLAFASGALGFVLLSFAYQAAWTRGVWRAAMFAGCFVGLALGARRAQRIAHALRSRAWDVARRWAVDAEVRDVVYETVGRLRGPAPLEFQVVRAIASLRCEGHRPTRFAIRHLVSGRPSHAALFEALCELERFGILERADVWDDRAVRGEYAFGPRAAKLVRHWSSDNVDSPVLDGLPRLQLGERTAEDDALVAVGLVHPDAMDLSPAQRAAYAEVYELATRAATWPTDGSDVALARLKEVGCIAIDAFDGAPEASNSCLDSSEAA